MFFIYDMPFVAIVFSKSCLPPYIPRAKARGFTAVMINPRERLAVWMGASTPLLFFEAVRELSACPSSIHAVFADRAGQR